MPGEQEKSKKPPRVKGGRKPLQVYLDYKQDAELSFVADKLNVSKAELVRRSLDEYLIDAIPPEEDPLMEMIGLAGEESGLPTDLAENHDYYLTKWERESWED